MQVLKEPSQIFDPNFVKVVIDNKNNALLFSRSVIPYHRDATVVPTYYEHIGVYAFRKAALLQFTQWPMTPLEAAEKLNASVILKTVYALKWWRPNTWG